MFSVVGALGAIASLLGKFFPDKNQEEIDKAAIELEKLIGGFESQKGQLEVNAAEAATGSIFLAGWRPFLGWVGGLALVYHLLLQPIVMFLFSVTGHPFTPPVFDMSVLQSIILGMLGLGGIRTFEKVKGVNTQVIASPTKVVNPPAPADDDDN